MNQEKTKYPKNFFILPIVISLIIGGLSGGVAGFVSASFFSGSFNNWLSNPLGVLSQSSGEQNLNQQSEDSSAVQSPLAAADEESATTRAVNKVSPAVVSIIVSKEVQTYSNNSPFGDFFDQFFGQPSQPTPGPAEKQQVGGGTGFIISADGLIITNKHVAADEQAEYAVTLSDGTRYDAKVLARDPFNDFAFLKIEAEGLPTASLGDSDKIKIGQTVIAIGFSLGEYSNTVTKGIVSGIGRDIIAGGGGTTEKLENVIQTDAAINPGNSGGPLINLQGEVIGINTAVNQQGQLIGFAIPINHAKNVIDSVIKEGRIIRPYLGVRYVLLNQQLADANKLDYNYGALILRGENPGELAVIPSSPADKAGLVENDIILEINGSKINQDNPLAEQIAKYRPGTAITLKVVHDGTEKTVQLELAEYPN